jgi:hypothetical protein
LAAGLLVGLVVWVFSKQLFDHWTFPWDFLTIYTASPAFIAATVGTGHAVAWSPFVASGFPVDVSPQAGYYFPGWWAMGALGVAGTLRVLTTIQVAHVLLGSVGVLALARARRLEWQWALLAAVAYLFFGGFYGESEHADYVRGYAYLPWLLWVLTPPMNGRRWIRLVALPGVAWFIASGAYPGETVSFAIVGLVYVVVALGVESQEARRAYRVPLTLAIGASIAACAVVLLPYIRAEQAGELHRLIEPTAAERAVWTLSPIDVLGLYLNNFAWTTDGTITAWAVSVPILVGLACIRLQGVRRHAPLVACGTLALVLATTPKIGVIGRAMASARPLFPSRFPAADYKAAVVVALIIMSVDAWSRLAGGYRARYVGVIFVGCLLVAGALFAPATYGPPTRMLWLVLLVIAISVAAALLRPPPRVLVCLVLALTVVDGMREINDYSAYGKISPWNVPPSALAFYRHRDGYIRNLPQRLKAAPPTRPARVPPAAIPEEDASGWEADAYHLTDYDPTIERPLWQAENNASWSALLLEPWHGYIFPCVTVGCSSSVHLPMSTTWRPSSDVHTLSYGVNGIVYSVHVSKAVLMVENELAVPGWQASTQRVRPVDAGIPLRAWRLAPGNYRFIATFHEPGRGLQYLALAVALVAWLGCALSFHRKLSQYGRSRNSESPASRS